MRSHLGYQASRVHVLVGTETGTPRRFAGIRGETYGTAWDRLRTFAFVVLAVALVLRSAVAVPEGKVPWVPTVLVYLAAIAFVVAVIGRVRTRRFAWVECKDVERPVSRQDIRTLNDAVEKARASETVKWKPAQVLVVAGTDGFERDALDLAQSLGIECHQRTESGFEQVS